MARLAAVIEAAVEALLIDDQSVWHTSSLMAQLRTHPTTLTDSSP